MPRALVLPALLACAAAALAQPGERAITDISAGFGVGRNSSVNLKLGQWAPVQVSVETAGLKEFRGKLLLTTADFDDSDNTVVVPNVVVPPSRGNTKATASFTAVLRFCKEHLPVEGRLVALEEDGTEREVHRFAGNLADGPRVNIIGPNEPLVCYYGAGGTLVKLKDDAANSLHDGAPTVTRFLSERHFPPQWIGYGGVDAVVLMTGNEKFFDQLPPDRQSALRTWVRQGGRLIVCCAKNWQIVRNSFLGPMLPAELQGAAEAPLAKSLLHETLTGYALPGGSVKVDPTLDPARAKAPTMLKMAPRPGVKAKKTDDDQPWLADGAYGLGRVTLIGLDFDDAPLADWSKSSEFWLKVLEMSLPKEDARGNNAMFTGRQQGGPAEQIAGALEAFPEVAVVPFHWVALLIFLYILLIGPVDYFLLKKVFKRLELTWITFPLWVVAISAAAYWSAYLLKGNELRINRLEIVDVDAPTGTLRGAAFVGLFSPRIAKYDLAYTADLAAVGKWSELAAGPGAKGTLGEDQWTGVSAAYGVPSSNFNIRGAESGGSLLGRRSYSTLPVANATLLGVKAAPVQVWSVKSFESRWLAAGKAPLEARLRRQGSAFRGTIANLLDVPLEDVVVRCKDYQVEMRKLLPRQKFDLAGLDADSGREGSGDSGNQQQFKPEFLGGQVRQLSFQKLFAGQRINQGLETGIRHLAGLDLTAQLELGRIVVLARVPATAGGALWLDQEPVPGGQPQPGLGKTVTHTYLRVVFDEAPGDDPKEQP